MKPVSLFISNEIYFDPSKREGGVKVCTQDYLKLIQELYDVELFKVKYRTSILYKLLVRIGLNIYNDYDTLKYRRNLEDIVNNLNIKIIFLNLSNTSQFAELLKKMFGNKIIVVLCSHGNESGDYLHEVVKFKKDISIFKNITSALVLGNLIKKESYFRQYFIDLVLTVSDVEYALEKWLGAKKIQMIPRIVEVKELSKKPILGRVGFLGDLSHPPNSYGIEEVCKALEKIENIVNIQLCVVGSGDNIGKRLEQKYHFVKYLGYLGNDELISEVSSWSFFLNPVFYYSRGVSTKLAKPLSWNIPTITTSIGCRGYTWKEGNLIIAESPDEFAIFIVKFSQDRNVIDKSIFEIKNLVKSMPTIKEVSVELKKNIMRIA